MLFLTFYVKNAIFGGQKFGYYRKIAYICTRKILCINQYKLIHAMKARTLLAGLFATLLFCPALGQSTEQLLLEGWKFQRGASTGAESTDFNDSKWEKVRIPHDWAIAGPFDKEIDKQVVRIEQNGEQEATEKTGRSGSLPWIGEGWYRLKFQTPRGQKFFSLVFDGAMAEPRVYINGKEAGYWAYGYNTFEVDITPFVNKAGESNTLAVHLQNVEESSRWYPGAGLYRPVRLRATPQIAIKTWGNYIRTTDATGIDAKGKTAQKARVTVTTAMDLHGEKTDNRNIKVTHTLLLDNQEVATKTTSLNESAEVFACLDVNNARLWCPEHPILYTLKTEVTENGAIIDNRIDKVGIRTISYTSEGFKLNGVVRKFKGVCLHHDLGPLGAAFNKAAFRRQIRLLKEIGCDAIRTSHNMPAPWQMDICDEMGMMVMAESCDMWVYPKCKNGYARFFEDWWERDFTNLVTIHRSHPSIVMWSIGNEIPEQGNATGLLYTRKIQDLIHRLDPTRPCTQGMDRGAAAMWAGTFQETDVPGFNYRTFLYPQGLEMSPKGFILGSETASTVSSRGVYKFPVTENHGDTYEDGQISSYDLESCIWSNLPDDDWIWQDKEPRMIGEFVWTGFDYLGEPTPYDEYWPSRSSYFGIYDLAGLPKDRAYLYRTHWAPEKETLHLLPHWTWPGREGQVTPVFCYTSYPEAELFINGKSQGRMKHIDVSLEDYLEERHEEAMPWGGTQLFANGDAPKGKNRLDRYRMRWMETVYEPGELKVVAYDANGNKAAEQVIRTAGVPDRIELVADRSTLVSTGDDTPDMAFVTVRILDKEGNLCPDADNQLTFGMKKITKKVKGQIANINSCCNGDATSLEVFTQPTMKAFKGEMVIVIEAGKTAGTAQLVVSGDKLRTARLNIDVK